MGNLERQRDYVSKCMTPIDPPHDYVRIRRQLNQAYHLTIRGQKMRVCKKFLMSTLNIGDRFIRTVQAKSHDGIIEQDRRGRHSSHRRVLVDIRQSVHDHINSIPLTSEKTKRMKTQTQREFIEGGKSLAYLYRDYKNQRERDNLPIAKLSFYTYVFNHEFNVGFHIPKKDQCELCTKYKIVQN